MWGDATPRRDRQPTRRLFINVSGCEESLRIWRLPWKEGTGEEEALAALECVCVRGSWRRPRAPCDGGGGERRNGKGRWRRRGLARRPPCLSSEVFLASVLVKCACVEGAAFFLAPEDIGLRSLGWFISSLLNSVYCGKYMLYRGNQELGWHWMLPCHP